MASDVDNPRGPLVRRYVFGWMFVVSGCGLAVMPWTGTVGQWFLDSELATGLLMSLLGAVGAALWWGVLCGRHGALLTVTAGGLLWQGGWMIKMPVRDAALFGAAGMIQVLAIYLYLRPAMTGVSDETRSEHRRLTKLYGLRLALPLAVLVSLPLGKAVLLRLGWL